MAVTQHSMARMLLDPKPYPDPKPITLGLLLLVLALVVYLATFSI